MKTPLNLCSRDNATRMQFLILSDIHHTSSTLLREQRFAEGEPTLHVHGIAFDCSVIKQNYSKLLTLNDNVKANASLFLCQHTATPTVTIKYQPLATTYYVA